MNAYQISVYIPKKVNSEGVKEAVKDCELIVKPKIKDTCYHYIMKSTNSSIYCKYIFDLSLKDDCYVSYSYSTNDYSQCSEIGDKSKRETCEFLKRAYGVESAYIS